MIPGMNFQQRLEVFWTDLSHFPWRDTLLTLRARFREDRMGLTASSLTFTTTIALVPILPWRWRCSRLSPCFQKCRARCKAGWLTV